MLKAQVIGIGAAGNKATLEAINSKVVKVENTMLVNSTLRDIPKEYDSKNGKVAEIGNSELEGCAKQREDGKSLALTALQNNKLDLDGFIKPDTDLVVVVTSTEGGTGSGASVIIAHYLKAVLKLNVLMFTFTGFEEDVRGLSNTVEFFKDLKEEYTVQILRNKKFLQEANGNMLKAETLANKEFAIRLDILLGNPIKVSHQNIDRRDLFKMATTHGYMDIQYREITDKIRNVTQFNEILQDMIDSSKGMDVNSPSQTVLGVIINIPENERDFIDYECKTILNHYGDAPFDKFRHIQSEKGMSNFISFISSGMKIPVAEIQDVYDKYLETTERVNKERDEFLSSLNKFNIKEEDNKFNIGQRGDDSKLLNDKSKKDFFDSFNLETPNLQKNNNSNKSIKTDSSTDMKNY